MTEPLIVLGKEEALRRIKPALGKASSSFPMLAVEEEAWLGDQMSFRVRALGQVAAGAVEVADDHVRLRVTLPWLLHKFPRSCNRPSQVVAEFCLRRNNRAARAAGLSRQRFRNASQ